MKSAFERAPELEERFEILALAGSGGMGRVYRARDRSSGAIVAVKLVGDQGDPERLEREAHILAELDHPGIVRYLDAGTTKGGTVFIVMEWLSGGDLDDRIVRASLSADEGILLAKRLAEALAAAHRRGVVHRDLKPANVLLVDGDVGRAKIIDFGLARREGDATMTAEGAVIGTPAYMSPEQIRGERVDARTDVYGLGAILFAALVGRAPFSGPHRVAVLAKAVAESPPRPSELRPDVPEALDDLVVRLLSKNKDARPTDAGEVALLLSSLALAPTIERRSPVAVTAREQRIACIILCGGPASTSDATVPERPRRDTVVDAFPPPLATLAETVANLGATLHPLTRNASLVTMGRSASPGEQATRAARCALAMARLTPGVPLVVATGRIVEVRGAQVGEVIDRATAELLSAAPDATRSIRIDRATADLIGPRFRLRGDGAWIDLMSEENETGSIRTFLGRPAPCVGRSSELASLESALAECISGARVDGPARRGPLCHGRPAPDCDVVRYRGDAPPTRSGDLGARSRTFATNEDRGDGGSKECSTRCAVARGVSRGDRGLLLVLGGCAAGASRRAR